MAEVSCYDEFYLVLISLNANPDFGGLVDDHPVVVAKVEISIFNHSCA